MEMGLSQADAAGIVLLTLGSIPKILCPEDLFDSKEKTVPQLVFSIKYPVLSLARRPVVCLQQWAHRRERVTCMCSMEEP
ncbi:hypothetical protein TNCV_3016091 [Trichonephila clavipes]|nr:hypothetical protein TNCV_3016091 [Trichonephila clavipes]